jgi:DNA-binding phage protein
MTTLTPFDVADYLDNEEIIAEYLTAALEDEDPKMFLIAIENVTRARGMAKTIQAPQDLGLSAILKLCHSLGMNLCVKPAGEKALALS